MEVYLDNAATTKVFESVTLIMLESLEMNYANPSSLHRKGMEAEQYIVGTKGTIALSLKCEAKEITMTSGGTEANNLAIIGTVLANRRTGNHIITTKIEHPSVLEPFIYLEEQGFRVTYLNVDNNGHVKMQELLDAIEIDTILVSIMYVNNEMGAVQDIAEMGRKIKEKNPETLFHVDAIQAYGKYRIFPKRLGIDLLTVSGHKIHGPKGVGFLYHGDKVKIKSLQLGGGQEKGLRAGTENVPGIAGLGQAIKEIYENHDEKRNKLFRLKKRFIEGIKDIPGIIINGCEDISIEETAPHIISVSFPGIRSEVLLHALEGKGVYVSSGSACASHHPQLSGTLKAIGVKKDLLDSTLRFSLSVYTEQAEIDHALLALHEVVPMLQKYHRH